MNWLVEILLGCSHPKLSWPRGPEGRLHRTCLSCGVRLKYHWPSAITKPVRYQGEGVDIDALRELNRL